MLVATVREAAVGKTAMEFAELLEDEEIEAVDASLHGHAENIVIGDGRRAWEFIRVLTSLMSDANASRYPSGRSSRTGTVSLSLCWWPRF